MIRLEAMIVKKIVHAVLSRLRALFMTCNDRKRMNHPVLIVHGFLWWAGFDFDLNI